MRAALAALLVFFESEPALAQIWLLDALTAGSWALEHRERNVARLRSMIVEHWSAPGREQPEPVAMTGVMASVLGPIQTHVLMREPRPLIEMLGPLMGLVTAPYLDIGGVEREIERGGAARERDTGRRASEIDGSHDTRETRDGGANYRSEAPRSGVWVLAALRNPNARRARECLLFLAGQGERGLSPSNREITAGIGVAHQSQISRLLAYLSQGALVVKRSEGKGKRNAWRLTERGDALARALSQRRG